MNNEISNYGFLIVSVTTALESIPLSDSVVTVSELINNIETPIAILETDIDGRTKKISLHAPPVSNSLTPTPIGPSYALYNIQVEKEGYYTASNLNVPIFQGITSIQPVRLFPVIASPSTSEYGENFPPPTEGVEYGLSDNEFRGEAK